MDALSYRLLPKSPELVSTRRIALDRYANIAQISQVLLFVAIPVSKWIFSTLIKTLNHKDGISSTRYAALLARSARVVEFRLKSEVVVAGYGTYEEWIIGLLWTAWLGFLCWHDTAPDYLHLTKRFGLISASQLPIHYLLAMKHLYSPCQLLLGSSHETIIVWHKVTGKIIILFCALHAFSYYNAFIQMNMFWTAIRQPKIVVGIVSIGIFFALGVTSCRPFRRRWYSWFYRVHVIGSAIIPMLLFFHVSHIRLYVLESAAVFVLNIILRTLSSQLGTPTVTHLTKTGTLMRISITDQGSNFTNWLPGQHVYLHQGHSRFSSYFTTNPFTIASLPTDGRNVVLIVRRLNGNTKSISDLAIPADEGSNSKKTSQLWLEGPYGNSQYLTAPREYTRVCLIAGGVGASYIIPMWRYFLSARRPALQEIRLVWAVRSIADTDWTLDYLQDEAMADSSTGCRVDERLLYVTGADAESKEHTSMLPAKARFVVSKGRPNIENVVDMTVFGNTGESAIFVSGPDGMVASTQRSVGKWVDEGKDVFWHAEKFGF